MKTCDKCKGSGKGSEQMVLLFPEIEHKCAVCCGFGWLPEAGGDGYWFYKMQAQGEAHAAARIACMVPEADGRWRVMFYAPCGPIGHEFANGTEVMQLVRNYRYAQTAASVLDYWSGRQAWKNGLLTAVWVGIQNLLNRKGHYEIQHEVWDLPLQEKIEIAGAYCAQQWPGVGIW